MSIPVWHGLAHDVIETRPSKLVIPAKLQTFADSLGLDVKELSQRISEDTLRRLVGASGNTIEHVNEDGTVKLERQIVAGHDTLISTVGADRARRDRAWQGRHRIARRVRRVRVQDIDRP